MLIEVKCECCGSKINVPGPPPKTKEEKVAFRKAWDERYERGRNGNG